MTAFVNISIYPTNTKLVGVTGFEPATSCSQSKRATNCATPRKLTQTHAGNSNIELKTYCLRQQTSKLAKKLASKQNQLPLLKTCILKKDYDASQLL